MAIITLTTDLGLNDYYVGALKGSILSQMPDVTIVDISHSIPPFDILNGAYVLRQAFPNFPKGTVHIIGVNSNANPDRVYLAFEYEGHFFIGSDNGIFSLLFSKVPDKIVDLSNVRQDSELLIFPIKDIFVKAACHLARGGTLEVLGSSQGEFTKVDTLKAVVADNTMHATVVYRDNFGNAVVNVSKAEFTQFCKGKDFVIEFSNEAITEISSQYIDSGDGNIIALFNESGMMELAQVKGKLSDLYNLHPGVSVTIRITE